MLQFGLAFRMRVLGCDLDPTKQIEGVENVSFDELLAQSDAIAVHIHLTQRPGGGSSSGSQAVAVDNTARFDAAAFGKMKRGCVLVNTSRGDVVDQEALLMALESGVLRAYGADVIRDEWRGDMRESPLVRYAQAHSNVVLTPHFGGGTVKSIVDARCAMTAARS